MEDKSLEIPLIKEWRKNKNVFVRVFIKNRVQHERIFYLVKSGCISLHNKKGGNFQKLFTTLFLYRPWSMSDINSKISEGQIGIFW